ncbi:MAG TPA: HNH endonuclease signature motif containing protein [Gemmatimonadales bacterium]|nr:HNH endonuclease signature motif containing protein [Gemmatimonadales bacterium]
MTVLGDQPTEGAPDPKPAKRIVATRSQWSDLRFEKLGSCRICGSYLTELHHLVAKSLRGDDIAANLVPLCSTCHGEVELHHQPFLGILRASLRPEELRYILDVKGSDYLERRYPA